ncbi:MAG: hypothetical protein ACI90V_002720 [Bacillariaceae sp.]|jgi:hypothetical protein
MQFKFENNYSSLLEKVRLSYKIKVTPPSVETIRLGRRRRAEATLNLLESTLLSQRQIFETTSAKVVELEGETTDLQNEINEKIGRIESVRADEERLREMLGVREQQRPPKNNNNNYLNEFN